MVIVTMLHFQKYHQRWPQPNQLLLLLYLLLYALMVSTDIVKLYIVDYKI